MSNMTARNMAVERDALLRILEIPDLNLDPDTTYPGRFYVIFISPSRQSPG